MKTMKTILTVIVIAILSIGIVLIAEGNTVPTDVCVGEELRQYIEDAQLGLPSFKMVIRGVSPRYTYTKDSVEFRKGNVYHGVYYIYSDGTMVGGIYTNSWNLMHEVECAPEIVPAEYCSDLYDCGDWLWGQVATDFWKVDECNIWEIDDRNYTVDP